MNHFHDLEQLKAFKEWVMTPDKEVLAAAQKIGRKAQKNKAGEDLDALGTPGEPKGHLDLPSSCILQQIKGKSFDKNIPPIILPARLLQVDLLVHAPLNLRRQGMKILTTCCSQRQASFRSSPGIIQERAPGAAEELESTQRFS